MINKNKYLKKIYKTSVLLFIFSFISTIVYFIAYIHSGYKPSVIMSGSITFVILFFLSLSFRAIVMHCVGENLLDRTDEKLTILSDTLIYSFRNKYETNVEDRIRIHIPIDNIEHVEHDKTKKHLKITGDFTRKLAKNCGAGTMPPHRGKITSEQNINEFIFFDYFEPSLSLYLQNRELFTELNK